MHRRSKVSHCLNSVPSPFHRLRRRLRPFRNPINIVLEWARPENGSLFRVRKAFFPREKHIKSKRPTKCANCYKGFRNVHTRSKASHCLNCVPLPFTLLNNLFSLASVSSCFYYLFIFFVITDAD